MKKRDKILSILSQITEEMFIGNHPKTVYPLAAVGKCLLYSQLISDYLYKNRIPHEVIKVSQNGQRGAPHWIVEIPGMFVIDPTLCQGEWLLNEKDRSIPHIIVDEISKKQSFLPKSILITKSLKLKEMV